MQTGHACKLHLGLLVLQLSTVCLTTILWHCRYALGMKDLFVALLSRDLLLLRRHSFVYIFRTMQVCYTA